MKLTLILFFFYSSCAFAQACNKTNSPNSVPKPKGVYTSVITKKAVANQQLEGGLVRAMWAEIEKSPGVYDFSTIDEKVQLLPKDKSWSLAVHGGFLDSSGGGLPHSRMAPLWLKSQFKVQTFTMRFRNTEVTMPKYWDKNLQSRLQILAKALADRYNSDSRLKLVYIPQMTSNGIEGHFNGVDKKILFKAADIDPVSPQADEKFETIWVQAATKTAKAFANAFDKKALAFEVHEVIGRVSVPKKIIYELWQDPNLKQRVGAAMWWISGKNTYQPELVTVLKDFPGDLYGQAIGKSDQSFRFENGDYNQIFKQAKELCMRYIEPWNYEFENNTNPESLKAFNVWAHKTFLD